MELDIQVDIKCQECRHGLTVSNIEYLNNCVEVEVGPCERCTYSQDALDDAFNAGRRDAEDEMESKIADLQDELEALKETKK